MINVCVNCGIYRADKIIDPLGPDAICPECGHRHRFLMLPLFIVAGASGTGKSTVCHALLHRVSDVVVLDADILWRPEFDRPESGHRDFFETWLRVCKNISQSGRPVVLFGAGLGVPDNLESCVERRYFSAIHYLALTCQDEVLKQRLSARPAWRGCGDPVYINEQTRFNGWFRMNANQTRPTIELLDTTSQPVEETGLQVTAWIRERIAQQPGNSAPTA